MNNKVETLRAICFTADDLKNIKNLDDTFSEKEIEFMVEFKKIYELGIDQLEKFINKLDEEGSELDTYTIMYYVEVLLNGPLGSYVKELSKDKKYFVSISDSMGSLGNVTRSTQNSPIYPDMELPLGCAVDTFNKLPNFCQTTLLDSVKITEDIFRKNLYSSTFVDNTLPIIDKGNDTKYNEEKTGEWQNKASGTYLNRDIGFFKVIENVSDKIFEKVKEYLGDENFRLYRDMKDYSPFDSEKNQSAAINSKVQKEYIDPLDDTKVEKIELDLMGDEFDSEKRRENVLKISGAEKDEEFEINTNEGQLGN